MKKVMLPVGLLLASVLALGPGSAVAHNSSFPTKFVELQVDQLDQSTAFAAGILKARKACKAKRSVKLVAVKGSSRSVIDRAAASGNGGFLLVGKITPQVTKLVVAVPRKRFGPKHGHNHVCKPAQRGFDMEAL